MSKESCTVNYPSDLSTRPSIELARVSLDDDLKQVATDIQRVGFHAWVNSEWVDILAEKAQISQEELAMKAFDPLSDEKIEAQIDKLTKIGNSVVYWTAKTLVPEEVVGFAKANLLAKENSKTARAKGFLGKGNVCLHDVNVLPQYKRKGIVSALAHSALGDFEAPQTTSLVTDINNLAMQNWAIFYGYKETGEKKSDKLFHVPTVEVTYQAESIASVRMKIEKNILGLEKDINQTPTTSPPINKIRGRVFYLHVLIC